MLNRRNFLKRSVQGSSLIAAGTAVPEFLLRTAETQAAQAAAGKAQDHILVVVELGGGNDGLNTVIPYGDDLYHKARKNIGYKPEEVLKLQGQDGLGLHPALEPLQEMYAQKQVAIVQGVGYPNPNRSHFESMDIWQSADPTGRNRSSGWLGRATARLPVGPGKIPAFHVSKAEMPLAMHGATVPTVHPDHPLTLRMGAPHEAQNHEHEYPASPEPSQEEAQDAGAQRRAKRQQLIRKLSSPVGRDQTDGLLQFVRRSATETYTTVDRLNEIVSTDFEYPEGEYAFNRGRWSRVREGLSYELQLVARMIQADFGARIYYVALDGFDTHSDQREDHSELLQQVASAIQAFFVQLSGQGDHKRVLLVTFSEFGRRVQENASGGTDHGAGSSLFVCGPAVAGGVIGEHPSLELGQLDNGDLAYHTDFRSVYATLLDQWLGCPSRAVLGGEFQHLKLLS